MYKLIVSCALCITFFAGQACFAAPRANPAIHKAYKELQANHPKKALELLESTLASSRPNVSAMVIAGNAYMELEETPKALALYKRGTKLYPHDTHLLQNKAVALYYLEQFAEAGDCFHQLSDLQRTPKGKHQKKSGNKADPSWYNSQYQAGVCYYKASDYNNALTMLTPLTVYPEYKAFCDTHRLIAHSYIAQKKWKEATAILASLLKTEVNNRDAWKLLAEVYIQRGKLKKGAAALQVAHSLKPATSGECMRLAKVYLQVNSPLLAVKSIKASPEPLTAKQLELLSIAQEKGGHLKRAAQAIEKAISLAPSPKRHFELAKIYFRNQQYSNAIPHFDKAAAKTKYKGLAYYFQGQCYLQLNQYDNAKKLFIKAKKYKKVRLSAASGMMLIQQKERIRNEEKALKKHI